MRNFTHVTRDEGEKLLHFSHLFRYVSAYELTEETLQDLKESVQKGVEKAKKERNCQIVDQDGEMFFVIYPSGLISLCLRWKSYKISNEA